jgi:hypothetical protein
MSGEVLNQAVEADAPIRIDMIDSPYSSEKLKAVIYQRGL